MTRKEIVIDLIKKAKEDKSDEYSDIIIPGPLPKKIIGYQSMRQDLKMILESCEILKTESFQPTIKASIWYSTIALYGKCFTDASVGKYPKLEAKEVFFKNKEFFDIHKKIMELRHDFVSHRGESSSDVGIGILRVYWNGDGMEIKVKQTKQYGPNLLDLNDQIKIVKYLISEVEKKYKKAAEKVKKTMFENFSAEELNLLRIN